MATRRRGGVTYALRFRAYGRREFLTLGSSADGWTRARADEELQNVISDVRRGIWRPPRQTVEPRPVEDPSFHVFASEWFEGKRRELRPNTIAAYRWEISHLLLPHFARHRLSEITPQEVDRYRQAKVLERERGRRLSNESINKSIARLAQILEVAVEYGYIERNAAYGRRRRLPTEKPRRSFIETVDQLEALLTGAQRLDRARRGPPLRRPLVSMLLLAGPRIDEALSLRWRDLDLPRGAVRFHGTKSDAAERTVYLLPVLRDDLLAYAAACPDRASQDLVFGTASRRRQSPSNVRTRVLSPAVGIANELLEQQRLSTLPDGLTPHALRRTFASILLALGENPRHVMAQMGHTTATLTLGVYAQVIDRRDGELERLRAFVDGTAGRGEPGRAPTQ